MDFLLNDVEIRIIGALMEKQTTTPEYYPLTLNTLVNACNQLSNREPVVSYDEKTVQDTLFQLRGKRCARMITGDGRVPKYEQILTEELELSPPEMAAMCVLMLRGPQTPGEIRGRTGRLFEFNGLAEVEETLQGLVERSLVARLPRQPGTKESRFAHLLSGAVETEVLPPLPEAAPAPSTSRFSPQDRIIALEQEVAGLRQELEELKQKFETFQKQFE
ncbi:MAG: YceH family protein [Blastocatellia bacterium]|nr:YceH family protein [Blastocatellia bacterium]